MCSFLIPGESRLPSAVWFVDALTTYIKGNKNFVSSISTPLHYPTPPPTTLPTRQHYSDILVSNVDTGHTLLSTDHCSHTWVWLRVMKDQVLHTACFLDNTCLPPWPSLLWLQTFSFSCVLESRSSFRRWKLKSPLVCVNGVVILATEEPLWENILHLVEVGRQKDYEKESNVAIN